MTPKERPISTRDLLSSERQFTSAMQRLSFGRFENLKIQNGELSLTPPPVTVRNVKFGVAAESAEKPLPKEFSLKEQVVEFLQHIRSIDAGEIRCLEIRNGLPFSMEFEHGRVSFDEQHHS